MTQKFIEKVTLPVMSSDVHSEGACWLEDFYAFYDTVRPGVVRYVRASEQREEK